MLLIKLLDMLCCNLFLFILVLSWLTVCRIADNLIAANRLGNSIPSYLSDIILCAFLRLSVPPSAEDSTSSGLFSIMRQAVYMCRQTAQKRGSAPPMGRTAAKQNHLAMLQISTHSPRVGRTSCRRARFCHKIDFNSLAPCGANLLFRTRRSFCDYFNSLAPLTNRCRQRRIISFRRCQAPSSKSRDIFRCRAYFPSSS